MIGWPFSRKVKPFMVEAWAVSASMRAATSPGFVIGPSPARRSARRSWRTVRGSSSFERASSSRDSVMSAGLPLKAARALPAAAEAASCSGVTSVAASQSAVWATV